MVSGVKSEEGSSKFVCWVESMRCSGCSSLLVLSKVVEEVDYLGFGATFYFFLRVRVTYSTFVHVSSSLSFSILNILIVLFLFF